MQANAGKFSSVVFIWFLDLKVIFFCNVGVVKHFLLTWLLLPDPAVSTRDGQYQQEQSHKLWGLSLASLAQR